MKRGIHWILAIYRVVLTPVRQTLGLYGCCRHVPTCSEYCRLAVERYGYWRGVPLCVGRLLRCHPWGTSGWDPVPGIGTVPTREKAAEREPRIPSFPKRAGDGFVSGRKPFASSCSSEEPRKR
ncbi:membrane protein insertion efficiency factor YidD [Methylacidimicrobium cyclopophantes]|uniref:membrane protein insertion efficiency factor YidD n=1 Tax=Methylacidimicrobium cyclopophantes TaxID=1041766 RepID=UPI001157D560|nr:membrane protein insertion efficiency factor YidD [Methylacidimicrobium cyclopophantes]